MRGTESPQRATEAAQGHGTAVLRSHQRTPRSRSVPLAELEEEGGDTVGKQHQRARLGNRGGRVRRVDVGLIKPERVELGVLNPGECDREVVAPAESAQIPLQQISVDVNRLVRVTRRRSEGAVFTLSVTTENVATRFCVPPL